MKVPVLFEFSTLDIYGLLLNILTCRMSAGHILCIGLLYISPPMSSVSVLITLREIFTSVPPSIKVVLRFTACALSRKSSACFSITLNQRLSSLCGIERVNNALRTFRQKEPSAATLSTLFSCQTASVFHYAGGLLT